MRNAKLLRVSLWLVLGGLVFTLVQALFLARTWDLARRELAIRASDAASDTFYRCRHDAAALEGLGRDLLSGRASAQDPQALDRACAALAAYGGFADALRSRLARAGLPMPFRCAVTLGALVARDGRRPPVTLLDAPGPAQERPLCGDLRGLGPDDALQSYYFMGSSHHVKLNLYFRVKGSRALVLGRMKGVLAVSALSFAVFLAACVAVLRGARQQAHLAALQDDFINTMTHELNTPLSTLAVAARSLRHETLRSDPEALGRLADVILRQIARLQHLVEGVRRLEEPDPALQREPLHVHDLLEGAAADVRLRYAERQPSVVTALEARQDLVSADPGLLASAICNLLDNAVKYSDGAPEITLGTSSRGRTFRLVVADRGVGIDRSHWPDLFERFFRVPRGRPGLGLGLHTAQRIARAHGGRITVDRRRGGGTTFTLRLPLLDDPDA